ncbi:FHA domain-containing protein [Adlercreutzia murintestinalis]|uniref:FHA domain-containing protein n=1 Tax=Adlercreutzia murintestinalis TaxID=2941325 RepID=UPI00203E182E|nr:FHA domain-containing protein [Adlercreutzia murintestinalis]
MTERCPVCRSAVDPSDGQCSVCGFKLVGTTRGFTPVRETLEDLPPAKQASSAVLRTIRGPRVGVDYALGDGCTTIGRNPSCNIFLNDMTVSREHATVCFEGGCHVLRDEHSFNGVWVNNQNVNAKALTDGDIIQIGAFAFIYEA